MVHAINEGGGGGAMCHVGMQSTAVAKSWGMLPQEKN